MPHPRYTTHQLDRLKFFAAVEAKRVAGNVTAAQVCRESGVLRGAYDRMKAGTSLSDIDNLLSLAKWAKLNIEDFCVERPREVD